MLNPSSVTKSSVPNKQTTSSVKIFKKDISLGMSGDDVTLLQRYLISQNIGSAANDIGFVKRADGTFGAIISDYDSGKHNTSWLNGLKRSYTEKVAIKTAAKNGFKYLGKKIVAGKVQIQFLDTRT